MSNNVYESGIVVPLDVLPLVNRDTGELITGATNIKVKVRRSSDGLVLDWDDMTFKAAGDVVQLLQVMDEVDATQFPGEYSYSLDLSAVTNANTYESYSVTVVEDGTSNAANLPQAGSFRVAASLDDATLARKAMYNDQVLGEGSANNLTLKDDDSVTDLAKWNIKDKDTLGISIGAGAPAIRERTL
jgi:hypothetical protein